MDGRRVDRNRTLTALAAAAFIGMAGYWAWVLLVPQPDALGPRVQVRSTPRATSPDAALSAPLVTLMSPGAVRTEVQVLGVLARSRRPLALLSIDGGTAGAYAPGQRLGPSTMLVAVAADAVQVEQAGQLQVLPTPTLPVLPDDGIVPVTGARTR